MPRKPKYDGTGPKLDALCDGKEFFTAEQAVALFGGLITESAVRKAVQRGGLAPGRIGNQQVFTRRDLARWREQLAEHAIASELSQGAQPIDVYLDAHGAYSLRQVTGVLEEWAKVTGVWLIEAPRGSYARWLQRMGLVRLKPRHLRRLIELMLTDPTVGPRVLKAADTLQLERVPKDEPAKD